MARKAAIEDANLTVEDYMAAPADRYRFIAGMNAPAKPAQAAAPTPASAPQQVNPQQPKP